MTKAERQEIAELLRRRLAEAEADESRAARVEADIDLSARCVGGKLDRTEAQHRIAAARAASARRAAGVARLRAALARTDRPDFGRCVSCGDPIPLTRFRVDPAATRCAECAGRPRQSQYD